MEIALNENVGVSLDENQDLKEIEIKINSDVILEIESGIKISNLPFLCFQNTNVSSIEDLNFNVLKKCKLNETNKYMVIFLGEFENTTNNNFLKKDFNTWHNKEPNVSIEIIDNKNKCCKFSGKMLKIFRKEYQPTTSE